jgi:hypothetical protein
MRTAAERGARYPWELAGARAGQAPKMKAIIQSGRGTGPLTPRQPASRSSGAGMVPMPETMREAACRL